MRRAETKTKRRESFVVYFHQKSGRRQTSMKDGIPLECDMQGQAHTAAKVPRQPGNPAISGLYEGDEPTS